jgi:hypothetical protein
MLYGYTTKADFLGEFARVFPCEWKHLGVTVTAGNPGDQIFERDGEVLLAADAEHVGRAEERTDKAL